VLRYLSDAYRAARQTIPENAKTDELRDLIEWLGELVRQVDSSLVDEWELLAGRGAGGVGVSRPDDLDTRPPGAAQSAVTDNRRAFLVLVRNELWRRVRLAALDRDDELLAIDPGVPWAAMLDDYYAEHDSIGTGPDARSAARILIEEEPDVWKVRQIIDDPEGDHDWGIRAEVDLAASAEEGVAVVRVLGLDRL
jgi:hypothetical protein